VEEPWTILELTELAAGALAATQSARASATVVAASDGAPSNPVRTNGRVREVPNERLVRWYVTVGLVDPPLSRRGRAARYGRRHLLQLVAVKRRQAEGRSLAEIQAELAGATDEALATVARVPAARPTPKSAAPEAPALAAPTRFWARASTQERDPGGAERAGGREPTDMEGAGKEVADGALGGLGDGGRGGILHGVRLAPGVTLLLEGADREPGPQDVTKIVNAARPLLEELASRRLCAFDPGHRADVPGVPPDAGQLAKESRT
jgi:DNA-binding transcriptional MerR regulator